MLTAAERLEALHAALAERLLVLDGAMGTMIQQRHLTAADFGGDAFEGCNELLVQTRPDVITAIHREYLDAGADLIETDTFGATRIVLAEYGRAAEARALNLAAAQLARQAADQAAAGGRPRWVAGSMGPTTKSITVTGGVTFTELEETFYEQALGLVEGGVDLLLVETCQDTRNIKAALLAIARVRAQTGRPVPVMISGTIEPTGTMLAGQNAEALWVSLAPMSPRYVSCYPNAGLPNEDGKYGETPESFAAQLARFADHGWLNIVGGCCGTTPAHIRAVAAMAAGRPPRRPPAPSHRAVYSGIEAIEAEESARPLLVGERTNVIGSRAFKELIAAEQWEEASEIGRRQVKNGAQIVDVCLQSTERDERKDIPPFYERLIRKIKAPVMIDTTDPASI